MRNIRLVGLSEQVKTTTHLHAAHNLQSMAGVGKYGWRVNEYHYTHNQYNNANGPKYNFVQV